jgi:hypothetical protein
MKKTLLSLSIVLAASMLASGVIAQTKGEADPAQSKAMPTAQATPSEKAAAKANRKAQGKEVAKAAQPGDATNKSMGAAGAATPAERAAAKQARKTTTAAAVKKGEIPSGEK